MNSPGVSDPAGWGKPVLYPRGSEQAGRVIDRSRETGQARFVRSVRSAELRKSVVNRKPLVSLGKPGRDALRPRVLHRMDSANGIMTTEIEFSSNQRPSRLRWSHLKHTVAQASRLHLCMPLFLLFAQCTGRSGKLAGKSLNAKGAPHCQCRCRQRRATRWRSDGRKGGAARIPCHSL